MDCMYILVLIGGIFMGIGALVYYCDYLDSYYGQNKDQFFMSIGGCFVSFSRGVGPSLGCYYISLVSPGSQGGWAKAHSFFGSRLFVIMPFTTGIHF